MFGLPGGEVLDFIEAARQAGIEFVLTRDEATAAFMADVTGQVQRRPGVCVSTLGPGAVNMTLGVANAYLDRSPVIAVTASMSKAAEPYATHQRLDLNAVYRPFTKATLTLDGRDTAAKVRRLYRTSMEPRPGPVHIALPSDVARMPDVETEDPRAISLEIADVPPAPASDVARVAAEIRQARRPVVILGLDLDPYTSRDSVRSFVERFGAPTFVTPKAKGILHEDHPLFFGVCAGVAADWVVMELLAKADLLLGVGFDPVESDGLWHHTMKLASIGPLSIADSRYRPHVEAVGNVNRTLAALGAQDLGPFEWSDEEVAAYRKTMDQALRPERSPRDGLSPYEVTLCLRQAVPRNTILATDVGAIKSVTSQGWATYEPLTFFESNGLSSMRYGFAGAMAARLLFPDRPVLCTIGDGGFGMTLAELETCVREKIHFVTVVYNDCALSLIQVAQEKKGYASYGVEYGNVNFALAAEALGARGRRVESLEELADAVRDGMDEQQPVVIDVPIDPAEYRVHSAAGRAQKAEAPTQPAVAREAFEKPPA
jgi:acetolactate synthase-1/2/3 large subunit